MTKPKDRAPPYCSPIPLSPLHSVDGFSCGKPMLDDWLANHAHENEGKASRTYVVLAQDGAEAGRVVAYYALAYGSVVRPQLPRKVRQGLPDPVPVLVLGRLAVDQRHKARAIGPAMLREAMARTLQASAIAGLRALLVHAIDDEAVSFYKKYGFAEFPAGTRTMFLPVETIEMALAGA